MSVYKPKNSPFYHYDFQLANQRFYGSTGKTSRREAEAEERGIRDQAKAAIKAARAAKGGPLTLGGATARYWEEVGQHHANSETTLTDLDRMLEYFGEHKLLASITDDDVTQLVQWRRSQRRWGRDKTKGDTDMPFISNATVNRSTTLVLKKLFTRAKRNWKHTFPEEPNWKDHWLREPKERVRELRSSESAALELATRSDYQPVFAFAALTGLRLKECLIKWSNVDWDSQKIETIGKGSKIVRSAMTTSVREILEPLKGHHPDWVFTYVASRTVRGNSKTDERIKGKRYPITYDGLKSQWKRIRGKANVENFRFHDFRHDVGTKLLRQTGNLKLVANALNHADIKTTSRYAHVFDEDVAAAMEKLGRSRKRDTKSRKKSRKTGNGAA